MTSQVVLHLKGEFETKRVEATRVQFSAHQCFTSPENADAGACFEALGAYLAIQEGLALCGSGPVLEGLRHHCPALVATVPVWTDDSAGIPADVSTVFLCETRALPRQQMRRRLPPRLRVLDADILAEIAPGLIPARGWTEVPKHIYPIDIPEIRFRDGLDLLLLDCPARNLALMPNGLGYVHNALKKTRLGFQTFDLDIVTYHRYHTRRIFDEGGTIVLPGGRTMPLDPWQAEHYDLWADPDVIAYLMPVIDEAAAALVRARPKILALSIQQCNETFSRALVQRVKAALPDTVILVGGFSCYNADIGLRAFPEADYMCIGESDLTVGPLAEALARGERPRDLAGVLSRHDTPGRVFAPAPMPHNLDQLDFPKYEWFDLNLYRNFNGYQLVPIIASRGCRWSRCTFCAERFYWRIRSAKNFVAELRWLVEQGCTLFMFNESDLNGMPDKLIGICEEIIRSGLKVKLTGQLRVNKKSDRAFFDTLRAAGFVALRFGVDAFSENTLRLQKKGYTTEMVSQNLKDCWEAGIYTEVNWVIGVPGETEADCDEGIDLILRNRRYIGRLANINPLILVNGGVYWIDPEAHNIRFRTPREELYQRFPRALPADQWYSTEPYIDAGVRKARFERIVLRLHEAGFPVGAWAQRVIEDVRLARDRNRAGPGDTNPPLPDARETPAAPDRPAPRLLRAVGAHNVVAYGGRFYGVPQSLGEVDLATVELSSLPGVVSGDSIEAVTAALDAALEWADSRGRYDSRKHQRAHGSVFRADSGLETVELPRPVVRKPYLVRFDGRFYAIASDAVAALETGGAGAAPGATSGQPLRRRIAARLPAPLIDRLRRLWQQQQRYDLINRGKSLPTERPSSFSVAADICRAALRELARRARRQATRDGNPQAPAPATIPGTQLAVINCVSKDAVPDLLTSYQNHNIVEFDGRYYAVPFGLPVDWEAGDAAAQPEIISAATANEVMRRLRDRLGGPVATASAAAEDGGRGTGPAHEVSTTPILLGTLDDHNLVAYEGWIYGLPHSLGPVDLAELDVVGMPGVIRDVSRDVVESEIRERSAAGAHAAA